MNRVAKVNLDYKVHGHEDVVEIYKVKGLTKKRVFTIPARLVPGLIYELEQCMSFLKLDSEVEDFVENMDRDAE